ncbi:MAG TPA: amino acid permease [Pirellulaceae bacterium]|nr:amino acid permease [Pirellulaceae bacterium]
MSAAPVTLDEAAPRPQLSLVDTTSIIVGIIIGSAIYESSPGIASGAGKWAESLALSVKAAPEQAQGAAMAALVGVWVAGALIALVGALCYAELATAYPRAGGTYVFLTEAFGKNVGFAFAWAEFWIVRPGNVGAIAFVLANYARQILAPQAKGDPVLEVGLAVAAIVVLTLVNAAGLRAGKWTQNLLTAGKLLGLAAIVVTAFTLPRPTAAAPIVAEKFQTIGFALIMVMFAYGGWTDMSFVAAEVRHPERNIFRALVLGTSVVAAIYLALTLAFVWALGIGGLTQSSAVAAEVVKLRFNNAGAVAISVLVVVSCLGAINGMLFTGARVYYALGTEHPVFRWLGTWDGRSGMPLRSLAVQSAVTVALVVGFGQYEGGFGRLVVFTAPFYWAFIALVGVALIVLRVRSAIAAATFRAPLFPLTPAIFALSCGAMVYASLDFAYRNRAWEMAWAIAVVLAGVIVGLVDHAAFRHSAAHR